MDEWMDEQVYCASGGVRGDEQNRKTKGLWTLGFLLMVSKAFKEAIWGVSLARVQTSSRHPSSSPHCYLITLLLPPQWSSS
jgi:hypothetical protein